MLGPIPFNNRAFFIAILALYEVLNTYEREQLQQVDRITRRKLEEANQQLTAYAQQADELATMRERAHFRTKLHDELQQDLVAVTLKQQAAMNFLPAEQLAHQELASAQDVLRGSLGMVRQLIQETHVTPVAVEACTEALDDVHNDLPLPDFIRKVTAYWHLSAELITEGSPRAIPPDVDAVLKYVVKEACFNIVKHAQATQVELVLNYEHAACVHLTIQDDGRGATHVIHGVGFDTIRQRVKHVDGKVHIDTAEDEGFELSVEVPA